VIRLHCFAARTTSATSTKMQTSAASSTISVTGGCSLWTRRPNTTATNGVYHGWLLKYRCMATCLNSTRCVALELPPVGCVLHYSADDLATTYNVPGVTLFILNRHCISTSPISTESPPTTTSLESVTGMPQRIFYVCLE